MTAKPIKPGEVRDAKAASLPDAVINAVNAMIVLRWDGDSARFTTREIVNVIESATGHTWEEQRARGWLDFEDTYRKDGWRVVFDAPCYNETYDSFFVFTKARG